jgi:Arc/MetJ family transcription regulator
MRTNIDIDDALLAEAGRYCRSTSKRALVHEALAAYVATKREERRRATYRDRLQRLRTRTADIRLRSDSREILRRDRDTR